MVGSQWSGLGPRAERQPAPGGSILDWLVHTATSVVTIATRLTCVKSTVRKTMRAAMSPTQARGKRRLYAIATAVHTPMRRNTSRPAKPSGFVMSFRAVMITRQATNRSPQFGMTVRQSSDLVRRDSALLMLPP